MLVIINRMQEAMQCAYKNICCCLYIFLAAIERILIIVSRKLSQTIVWSVQKKSSIVEIFQ
jgi:hypothetical protein